MLMLYRALSSSGHCSAMYFSAASRMTQATEAQMLTERAANKVDVLV